MGRYAERIVCLTEETTETLYLLGEEQRIVGISGFTVRPPAARREKPKVCTYLEADYEAIARVAPDLVLGFSDLQADIARELIKRGYNVVVFNQRSIADILRMVVTLGALVGRQSAGEALADRLQAGLDQARVVAAKLPRRPRVYFEEWPDPLISGIRWVSELIEIAGGIDVFEELRTEPMAKNRIVQADEVVRRDPEVIVASWCGKKAKLEAIAARAGWAATSAVRHGHLYEVKSALILQPGPAALTDGLAALQRCIAQVRSW